MMAVEQVREKIKLLINEEVSDEVLDIYIERAVSSILAYLNNPRFDEQYILENFEAAVIMMVEDVYLLRDKRYVKQYRQGKRSVTYSDSVNESIPADVRNILPAPYLRMW